MIEVQSLSKRYGSNKAVDNISFTVNDGEILGFLGPNGAGKTTTMNILTGYLSSSSGNAKINGIDVLEDPIRAKKEIGYLPEQPPLYPDMTVKEYLSFIYDLKKCTLPKDSHLAEICSLVKIENVYTRLIKNLSKGYKQRVGLAQALVGNPRVLILDEPTVGLDPKQIIEIRTLIKSLGKNHTVILSSHILPEVSAVCDRIVVINKGKLVADGNPEELSKTLSADHRLTVRIEGNERNIYSLLTSIPNVNAVRCLGEKEAGAFDFTVEADEGKDIRRELFKRLSERGMPLLYSKSMEMSLEDIFLNLTGEGQAE
ncbi:MAG: ATP-binding cassette domain-containing protein [Oscillospiraceae bacterium]|nr:ATP-binding cassette domain-containing protein [Oscillospiraceae bacterium]